MTYTKTSMARAFNEWLRRYTETPEEYQREWKTVLAFLDEDTGDNDDAQYGYNQAEYFINLMNELAMEPGT